VKNDNTISVDGTPLQLLPTRSRLHFAKAKVDVNLWADGSFHVFHPKEGEIPCEVISWAGINKRVQAPYGSKK